LGNGSILMLLDNAFRPDPRVANEARSLARAGYRVTIIAWDREGGRPPVEDWQGVRVERIHVASRHGRGSRQLLYLALFWWHAFWRAVDRRVDAVHCHDFDTLPLGWLIAALKGCRLVYDAHESYADMLAANVAPWIKRAVNRAERFLCRRADAEQTVGELLAADLRRRGAARTWVVGNWKPLEEFAAIPPGDLAARRAELGFGGAGFQPASLESAGRMPAPPSGGLLVAYIGWLNADRGIAPLLEAVADLEGVFLLVGGDGPSAAAVRRAAAACPRVRYLGFVDPARVPLYTSMADVIYYGLDASNPNARYSAPNKLFEALAAGKAVVCNECGEIGRIVREEACGRVVARLGREELAAALRELREPDRLAACQAHAREAGRLRYNWAQAERELLALYESLGVRPPAAGFTLSGGCCAERELRNALPKV